MSVTLFKIKISIFRNCNKLYFTIYTLYIYMHFILFFTYNINVLSTVDYHLYGPCGPCRYSRPRHKFSAVSKSLALIPIGWACCPPSWGLSRFGWWSAHIYHEFHVTLCALSLGAIPAQHLGDFGWLGRFTHDSCPWWQHEVIRQKAVHMHLIN